MLIWLLLINEFKPINIDSEITVNTYYNSAVKNTGFPKSRTDQM